MSFSQQLNFSRKPKSVASRSTRLNLFAANGSSFTPQQTITFNLPQIPRSYFNLGEAYLKMRVKNTSNIASLQQSGYSLIDNFKISTNNGVVDDLQGFAAYHSILFDSQVDPQVYVGVGEIALGTGGDAVMTKKGCQLAADGTKELNLPLYHSLFAAEKCVPSDISSPLRFDIRLSSMADALVTKADGALPGDFVVDEVSLILPIIELSPDAEIVLSSQFPDFSIAFESLAHTQTTKANAATILNENLGMRYSSVNMITMAIREQALMTTDGKNFNSVARTTGDITEIGYRINGQQIPQKKIQCGADNNGEVLMENLKAWGDLGSRIAPTSLQTSLRTFAEDDNADADPTAATHGNQFNATNISSTINDTDAYISGLTAFKKGGTFFSSIDLNTMPAISTNSPLYAGVSTLGSGIQTDMTFTDYSGTGDLLFDFWVRYTAILSLDPISRSIFVSV